MNYTIEYGWQVESHRLVQPSNTVWLYTDKKENQIFRTYKGIQSGAVAKSYMRKGFLIYEEMRKYFPYMRPLVIYDFVKVQLLHSEFP